MSRWMMLRCDVENGRISEVGVMAMVEPGVVVYGKRPKRGQSRGSTKSEDKVKQVDGTHNTLDGTPGTA